MGFLTFLYQDHLGGLEVQTQQGTWLEVPPVSGSFVINLGDMLEYVSRGILRATKHRVKTQVIRIDSLFLYSMILTGIAF